MNVKRLHQSAVLPQYANADDSGFDLVACEDVIIAPGETKLIPTGLAFGIPHGFEIQIRPRSGITSKTKLRVQLGTVDKGYIGEVGVIVDNTRNKIPFWMRLFKRHVDKVYVFESLPDGSYIIRAGDKIAQGVLSHVWQTQLDEVSELGISSRGANGFGSTGVR